MFTPQEYQEFVTNKMKKDFESPRIAVCCQLLGLAGETGELCDGIKKSFFHDKEYEREKQVKEMGDVLFYLIASAELLGITFDEIIDENVKKLNARYPKGFDPARAHAVGQIATEDRSPISGKVSPEPWPVSAGE
jgi:NTP pyrophosphatase (non-canonical NTP hydrolase)